VSPAEKRLSVERAKKPDLCVRAIIVLSVVEKQKKN
jgi:hypothetical protein